MDLKSLKNLSIDRVNKIKAEIEKNFLFQIAHINLDSETDPSAVLEKTDNFITIISDKHSYHKSDRIFPINQDENSVFAQQVFQDSIKNSYSRVLDLCTGSGVIAMALAKAGANEIIATDINSRAKKFIKKNNEINNLSVKFIESNLFTSIKGKFDKITINPPFMPAPNGTFPLHAQGGILGTENVVLPFFKNCWNHTNKGGCIQGIFHSFANDESDTILDTVKKYIPSGWSYKIKHVFLIKNIPIELYTTSFIKHKHYKDWIHQIKKKKMKHMRFFILTIKNNGKNGLLKEEISKPRSYSLIYPPTTLNYLSKHKTKIKLLKKPVSENKLPMVGHLMRLSRYNYFVYITLNSLLD